MVVYDGVDFNILNQKELIGMKQPRKQKNKRYTNPKGIAVSFYITAETHSLLKAVAESSDSSISRVACDLVTAGLKDSSRKILEQRKAKLEAELESVNAR